MFSQGTQLGNLEGFLGITFSPNSTPILFLRKSISKALQKSILGCTTPPFCKWYDARALWTPNDARHQKQFQSGQNLFAHFLFKEIGACLRLLWFSTTCMYLKLFLNVYRYVKCFVSFVPLLFMEYLLFLAPSNSSNVIQLAIIFIAQSVSFIKNIVNTLLPSVLESIIPTSPTFLSSKWVNIRSPGNPFGQ